jgi:hypothetical protein
MMQQPQPELPAVLSGYSGELDALIEIVKAARMRHPTPLQDAAVKSLKLSRRILESLIEELNTRGAGVEKNEGACSASHACWFQQRPAPHPQ